MIWLMSLFSRRRVYNDLSAEINEHIDEKIEEFVAKGMSRAEATAAARKEFGNTTLIEERGREVWRWSAIENLFLDARYGLRMLRKNLSFTVVAVLTLALGIGANTAIFSLVNSLLMRPLPVNDPAQITLVGVTRDHGNLSMQISYPMLEDLRHQPDSPFTGIIAFQFGSDGMSVDGKAYGLFTNYVTGNYFDVLGVKPALGRLFLPTEGITPGADPVIVLSYSLWKARFGGDPTLVGRKVLVDGHPFTIIGVAPEGFHGLVSIIDARAYIPFAMHVWLGNQVAGSERSNALTDRKIVAMHAYGRLKPGVGAKQAEAALGLIAGQIAKLEADSVKTLQFQVFPELQARPDPQSSAQMRPASGLFLALAAFVLILACMNVANILLVRATLRRREMAIRSALGGTRSGIVRLMLTESVLLALLGGAGGIFLGMWLSGLLSQINLGSTLPIILDFSFDWRVFGYAFAAAMVTGVLVGIVPAVRASRGNLADVLHESGRTVATGKHRLRTGLVIAQVAGSLMLLIMAGLFARSMQMAEKVNLGFDPSNVANLSFDPRGIGYTREQGLQFSKSLLDRVRALPGVTAAGLADNVPFGYYSEAKDLRVDGYTPESSSSSTMLVSTRCVSPDYFKTMRISLLRGRDFSDADTDKTQHVAIINQAMAEKFWPNQDPLGRQFVDQSHSKDPLRVVGVAGNIRYEDFSGPSLPFFYTAMTQDFSPLWTLHVRTSSSPENILPVVQQEIDKLAPGLPLFDVGTMTQALNTLNGLLLFQVGAGIAAALGLLGLALAIIGVYGIVSYVTSQRTHEIGIRMALGANPAQILMMVLRQGLLIVGGGLLLGLITAAGAGHLAESMLVGVSPTDPLTFGAISIVLAGIALFACYIPARRATKVHPMEALRYE